MGCGGYAAAKVGYHQVYIFIGLAKLSSSPAGHALVVQRMEEALALKALVAGEAGKILHLVNAYGVNEKCGYANLVSQLLGKDNAQI